jgi:hypothetical protein
VGIAVGLAINALWPERLVRRSLDERYFSIRTRAGHSSVPTASDPW